VTSTEPISDAVRLRRLCGLVAFLVPAIAYLAGASHEPAAWDTAELQGVPWILGIAHPTGFPFYTLLGYAWSHVLPFDTIAYRLNALCAIAGAATALAGYLVALEFAAWPPVAMAAAWWFAFDEIVWSHAVRAEAQVVAVTCAAFALVCFLRWMRTGTPLAFAVACALFGLGVASHPNAIWIAPALVLGCILASRKPSWRLMALGCAAIAIAFSLYLYLPLRSWYVVAHGLDPVHLLPGAAGGIFWNYNDPSTPAGLIAELTGSQTGAPGYALAALNPLKLQDALWAFFEAIGTGFGAFALIAVAAGSVALWKRDLRRGIVLVLACLTALVFSVTYANEADIGRYRLLGVWLSVPLLAAIAPVALPAGRRFALARIFYLAFLLAGAGSALYARDGYFNRHAGEGGRWIISAVAPYVSPGGVIVVNGWLDATSLAYGAYADRSLPGRIIVSGYDGGKTALYASWAKDRPVFVLTNPRDVPLVPGARAIALLDAYHELFRMAP
jgi:Protein of unknown function (DUF2723)